MTYRVFLALFYLSLTAVPYVLAWSNGGYSIDPSNPDYGTHDWVSQHALDWLPDKEKQYLLNNLAFYLYGTELPDNSEAPDGIGDVVKHHIYFNSNGVMLDDSSAARASTEFSNALGFLASGNFENASKRAGVMSHYIADMAAFGHVMANGTDWGPETHHSDYETYANVQTSSYLAEFNTYLVFDGTLDTVSAYDAAKNLAYDTTFDIEGGLTCVWMDQNYNWSNSTFTNRAGESLNLAVNFLTDVLHTLYLEAYSENVTIRVPRDYATIQQAINTATAGTTIHVEHGIYDSIMINKSLTIVGEGMDNTIIDGRGADCVVLVAADNVCIRGFKIQNGNFGIKISDSARNALVSNIITGTSTGISFSNCNETTIRSNMIKNNDYGIALDVSNRNTITRNTVSNDFYGIDIRYSQNNNIACNNLASNVNNGLLLYECTQNVIMGNSLKSNGQNGAYFQHCSSNVLYHNNFINNTNQVYQYDSSDTWFFDVENPVSKERVSEGNYWSDYAGADTDGDYIGETLLPHQGVDNYPIMEPWGGYPTAHFTCDTLVQMVGKTLVFNASLSYDEDGLIVSFTWNFGDGNKTASKDTLMTHSYATFGDYTVTLIVADNDTLTDFFVANLTIYTIPAAAFTYMPNSPTVDQAVTFNASLSAPNGGTITNYSWDFNTDGVIDATGMIVNHTYSTPRTYNITLTVTNTGGLTHASASSLTIAAKLTPPGLFGWLQSPAGITVLIGATAFAIGVPVAIVIVKRRRSPSPILAPPRTPPPPGAPPTPAPILTPSLTRRLERGPKAVITVSKANGEYTVMVEGPETYPIKLKHQLKVDDKMRHSLVRDFDTTALIANYWHLSRSGKPLDTLPEVPTTDIITHLERTGRLMYKYMTPANIARFFKTAKIDHLWLEIDESLLEIPWELMHDGDDFICLKYAVGRRILTAQIYEARPPKVIEKPHFLLIGDPSNELPDAKREIQQLKKHLEKLPNVEVSDFSGSEVTKLDFLQMISEGKYDCIHYAGHAGFNVERPDESYLKFSDGLCYAFEAKRLIEEENPPEIVFVNACSSAKEPGQTSFEKEIGGLARTFLFKGSMGYIGALWPIHDEAVAQLSVSFYTKLISGLSIGEALRQARKESFLKHKGKEIAWASFTLYGDPNLKLL